jgi:hypothetical protein
MIYRHTEIPETLRYKLKLWCYNSNFFSVTAIWRVIAG